MRSHEAATGRSFVNHINSRQPLAPLALGTHPSVPARNVSELVAIAKNNPGQFNCASAGVGNSPAEFTKFVHDELKEWADLIKKMNIKI